MRCKVGDLAFIVRSRFPENIGRIVKVVERTEFNGGDWLVVPQGAPLSAVSLSTGAVSLEKIVTARDAFLRPIRGEPKEDVTEREKELITC